jgi:hypothetical protein
MDTLKFPATRRQLDEAGWTFKFARACRRCHVNLEFYVTPAKKLAPLEGVIIDQTWVMVSHFLTCPFRDDFKQPKPTPAPTKQGNLFQ